VTGIFIVSPKRTDAFWSIPEVPSNTWMATTPPRGFEHLSAQRLSLCRLDLDDLVVADRLVDLGVHEGPLISVIVWFGTLSC